MSRTAKPDGPTARWVARGEVSLPPGTGWLTPAERARAGAMPFTKRRGEFLLRRLVAKHAVAIITGRSLEPSALSTVEVANAPDGAPEVRVDGVPFGRDVSVTDRAGWAVCVVGTGVGCDLELVEPRSAGFVDTFLTAAERRFVTGRPGGEQRDVAANLVWSAKESGLKVLRTGLRRDTRDVEVSAGPPGPAGWGTLRVRTGAGPVLPGWWRREGRFLLTVVTAASQPPPQPLDRRGPLATATPRHSWLTRPR
ncbi:4'-phosphopantetheinyl transferase family protein [Virgisporangium ochraceum]|uniref:4'-phosphopantetheinyl transferase family protein n=1 Tax=Virgisporangium ochraceum TaxID=65505 RepID=UPI00194298AA|nr:4'-phosphopantetheinyl transferase superfamily protein [Virgisporangium ochraceum]